MTSPPTPRQHDLNQLLLESIPTRPTPAPAQPDDHWTPQEQDAHWATLCAAVGTPNAKRPNTPHRRPNNNPHNH